MKKKLLISSILGGIIIIGGGLFFMINKKTIAAPSIQMKTNDRVNTYLVTQLYTPSYSSKKDLLKTYCEVTKGVQLGFIDKDTESYYAPQNSLFLATLCAPFKSDNPFVEPVDGFLAEGLNKDNPRKFIGDIPASCDPDGEMRDCDFSILLPTIFTAVMNDHSTLAMAGKILTTTDIDDAIIAFSNEYFGVVTRCDPNNQNKNNDSKNGVYLGTKSSNNENEAICSHPKTYSLLRDYFTTLQNQKKNLKLINSEKLSALKADSKCSDKNRSNDQTNLLACAYVAGHANPSLQQADQYNVRYNELLFYRLFIKRASDQLQTKNLNPLNLTENQGSQLSATTSTEIQLLEAEVVLSQKAIANMQRSIANFYASFPLHIGLSAYYEDVLNVRKSLAKIYTPIHQLYYKLRNIQQNQ